MHNCECQHTPWTDQIREDQKIGGHPAAQNQYGFNNHFRIGKFRNITGLKKLVYPLLYILLKAIVCDFFKADFI